MYHVCYFWGLALVIACIIKKNRYSDSTSFDLQRWIVIVIMGLEARDDVVILNARKLHPVLKFFEFA